MFGVWRSAPLSTESQQFFSVGTAVEEWRGGRPSDITVYLWKVFGEGLTKRDCLHFSSCRNLLLWNESERGKERERLRQSSRKGGQRTNKRAEGDDIKQSRYFLSFCPSARKKHFRLDGVILHLRVPPRLSRTGSFVPCVLSKSGRNVWRVVPCLCGSAASLRSSSSWRFWSNVTPLGLSCFSNSCMWREEWVQSHASGFTRPYLQGT